MNKIKGVLILVSLVMIFVLTSCDDKEASCPDGMVSCDANGNNICVPANIGC